MTTYISHCIRFKQNYTSFKKKHMRQIRKILECLDFMKKESFYTAPTLTESEERAHHYKLSHCA